MVPDELIPRCPHCGAEMFPWVRGYGNFLQGKKYEEEYEKISKYIQKNKDRKILLIELGVGRMTPMFIQEPFWELTNSLKDAYYISVNSEYQFLPEFIEDKGIAILGDIGTVLKDLRKAKEESAFEKAYKGLQGWGDRFEKASLKSMVGGGRIDAANTAADHVNIMKKAYELGKNI